MFSLGDKVVAKETRNFPHAGKNDKPVTIFPGNVGKVVNFTDVLYGKNYERFPLVEFAGNIVQVRNGWVEKV